MLTAYPAVRDVSWLDLLNPTDEEKADVESRYGLQLPSRKELSEVESSSRVREDDGVLFLSLPIVSHAAAPDEPSSPVGFVLSKSLLVTIRYTQLRSFDTVAAKCSRDGGPRTSVETFAALIGEIVDLSADLLEGIAAELDAVSRAVFAKVTDKRRHLTRSNDALRDVLIDVGNAGARLSGTLCSPARRDALRRLQIQRPVNHVCVMAPEVDQIPARAAQAFFQNCSGHARTESREQSGRMELHHLHVAQRKPRT